MGPKGPLLVTEIDLTMKLHAVAPGGSAQEEASEMVCSTTFDYSFRTSFTIQYASVRRSGHREILLPLSDN